MATAGPSGKLTSANGGAATLGIVAEHVEQQPLAVPQLEHLEHPAGTGSTCHTWRTPASA